MRYPSCLKLGLVTVILAFAGCMTDEPYGKFTPKGELAEANPTAAADYGKAMAHSDQPMAYEWQRQNAAAIAEATTPDALIKFVESDDAARALLAKIGTAYDGDPLALTQIAAVTQLCLCQRRPEAAYWRARWVRMLERTIAETDDGYVKTFCRQQLRLCHL